MLVDALVRVPRARPTPTSRRCCTRRCRLHRQLRGAQAARRRARLPRPADPRARPGARRRAGPRRVPAALPLPAGRRVPGHRSAAGRAAAAAGGRRADALRRQSVGVPVRPGALFIVGDPKQSIYRFRRADVGVYRRICERAARRGRPPRACCSTSFRSVPAHPTRGQRCVQRAHDRRRRDAAGRATSSCSRAAQRLAGQPAVVALPVPRPLQRARQRHAGGDRGVAARGHWRVRALARRSDSGWHGARRRDRRRRRAARSRPATSACCSAASSTTRTDVTRAYVRGARVARRAAPARRRQGVPRARGGRRAAHGAHGDRVARRRAVGVRDAARPVLRHRRRGPARLARARPRLPARSTSPTDVPAGARPPSPRRWRVLRDLNRQRNHRPVAETIGRLLEATRAHAGFMLWRGGEQVLANVLQIAELARQYEAEGGLSFRGFVDELRDAADRAPTPEAPILEEGTDGVRLMTVHKAKGLEFPVVILADIGCKLQSRRGAAPSRRRRAAWRRSRSPAGRRSTSHDTTRSRRRAMRAEGVRLAYVAATRARDLLVVPAIGDGPVRQGLGLRRCPRRSTRRRRDRRRRRRAGVPRPRHGLDRPAGQRRDAAHHAARRLRPSPIPSPAAPTRSCGGIRCCSIAGAPSAAACATST